MARRPNDSLRKLRIFRARFKSQGLVWACCDVDEVIADIKELRIQNRETKKTLEAQVARLTAVADAAAELWQANYLNQISLEAMAAVRNALKAAGYRDPANPKDLTDSILDNPELMEGIESARREMRTGATKRKNDAAADPAKKMGLEGGAK